VRRHTVWTRVQLNGNSGGGSSQSVFHPLIAPEDLSERDENNNNQSTLWAAAAPGPAASQLHSGGGGGGGDDS